MASASRARKKPTVSTLTLLPYVVAFWPRGDIGDTEPLLECLLEEFNVAYILKGLYGAVEYLPREVKEREKSSVDAATRAVSKQYRRASIQVHPDRYGDAFEEEFDELVEAYSVLQDPDFRHSYVWGLLNVVSRVGESPELLRQAHEAFVRDHIEKLENETDQARYQKARSQQTGPARPLYIEGGIHAKTPRKVEIVRIDDKSKTAQLQLRPLEPFHAFLEYCTSIHIVVEGADGDAKEIAIKGKALDDMMQRKGFSKTVYFEDWGFWNVSWFVKMQINGISMNTPHSVSVELDVSHPEYKRHVREKPALLAQARRRTGELKFEIGVLKTSESRQQNRAQIETRYWALHRITVGARETAQRLAANLEFLDEDLDACKDLTSLREVLNEAAIKKSQLDDMIAKNQKLDSLKAFKHSLAAMIENGEAGEWIKNVSADEITNHGGEVNRLYQLLTEGTKANSLLLDTATLQNAAERTDLFSSKQCEILSQRSSELEAKRLAETERLLKENQEREAAEKVRKEMQERSSSIGLERGTYVKIQGLTKNVQLNGSLGIYMGLAPNDRYIVRLWGPEGKEISLQKGNFVRYEYQGNLDSRPKELPKTPPSWPCSKCTYQNEGTKTCCELCGTGRGQSSGSNTAATLGVANHGGTPAPKSRNPLPSAKQTLTTSRGTPSNGGSPGRKSFQLPSVEQTLNPSRGITDSSMLVRKTIVPTLIGRRGQNIKVFEAQSNAKIHIDDDKVDKNGNCLVIFRGSPEAVRKAREMVESFQSHLPTRSASSNSNPTAKKRNASSPVVPSSTSPVQHATKKTTAALFDAPTPAAPKIQSVGPANNLVHQDRENIVNHGAKNESGTNTLLRFLRTQSASLKCAPDVLYEWLVSQDVDSLTALSEAVNDEDFMTEIQAHGVKGYKKAAFKKDLCAALSTSANDGSAIANGTSKYKGALADYLKTLGLSKERFDAIDNSAPDELQCSISFVLMVVDPVLASDGYTYERHEIANWIATKQANGEPVTSPQTNQILADLSLVTNISMRNMAREYLYVALKMAEMQ